MKKKIIAFLLAFVLILSVIPFPAMAATLGQGNCGDNLTWKLSDTGTLTISGTGAMYDYNSSDAPWKIKTTGKIKKVVVKEGVTSIGDNAFWACSNLKSVALPDSVTSIGWSAFSNCPIQEITLPANLKTIEARAFETTNLSSIKIPSKVKTIGMMAFSGTKPETVAVPASVTVLAGGDYTAFYHIETLKEIKVSSSNKNYSAADGVLFNKDKTQLMQYPQAKSGSSYTIPSSVKIIEPGAFLRRKAYGNYHSEGCSGNQL